jgi:O-antigen chain-terminating methyltransferase
VTPDPETNQLNAALLEEARARRAAAGEPAFPKAMAAQAAAGSQRRGATARQGVETGAARRGAGLLAVPGVGYLARLLVHVARLPVRMQQIYDELATIRARLDRLSAWDGLEPTLPGRVDAIEAEFVRELPPFKILAKRMLDEVAMARTTWTRLLEREAAAGAKTPPAATVDGATGTMPAGFDSLYLRFEDQFRGTPEDVKAKLGGYTRLFSDLPPALRSLPIADLGCGRGEWLGIVKGAGLEPVGIDLNESMVETCKAAGFTAEAGDAIEALRRRASGSLAAVTAFHVVEHLPFAKLMALLYECHRVVAPGGFVLFETPNPENILVATYGFHTDPTHRNPLPPPTLGFLVDAAGFHRQEVLRPPPLAAETPRPADPFLATVHDRFHAPPDYAIVGFR